MASRVHVESYRQRRRKVDPRFLRRSPDEEAATDSESHERTHSVPVKLLVQLFSGPETFTATEIAEASETYRSTIYPQLKRLEELGWIESVGTRLTKGQRREEVWRRTVHLTRTEVPYDLVPYQAPSP